MFTGLIQSKAKVLELVRSGPGARLIVEASQQQAWTVGESIALNGICLTLVHAANSSLQFDLSPETLARSTASHWKQGKSLNFERALRLGDSLGGHLVQGHVDGVGTVRSIIEQGSFWKIDLSIPKELQHLAIPKGSITVDGVSLTINDLDVRAGLVSLQLIPETLARTTLKDLRAESLVNLEMDMIVKTVSQVAQHQLVLKQEESLS